MCCKEGVAAAPIKKRESSTDLNNTSFKQDLYVWCTLRFSQKWICICFSILSIKYFFRRSFPDNIWSEIIENWLFMLFPNSVPVKHDLKTPNVIRCGISRHMRHITMVSTYFSAVIFASFHFSFHFLLHLTYFRHFNRI